MVKISVIDSIFELPSDRVVCKSRIEQYNAEYIEYTLETDDDGNKYIRSMDYTKWCGTGDVILFKCDCAWVAIGCNNGLYRLIECSTWDEFPYRVASIIYRDSIMIVNAVSDSGDTCWFSMNGNRVSGNNKWVTKRLGDYRIWVDENIEFRGVRGLRVNRNLSVEIEPYVFRTMILGNQSVVLQNDKESASFTTRRNRVIDKSDDYDEYLVQTIMGKGVDRIAFKNPMTNNILKNTYSFYDLKSIEMDYFIGSLGGSYDSELGVLKADKKTVNAFLDTQRIFNIGVSLEDILLIRDGILKTGKYNSNYKVWEAMKHYIINVLNKDKYGNEWGIIVTLGVSYLVYRRGDGDGIYLMKLGIEGSCLQGDGFSTIRVLDSTLIDRYNNLDKDRILRKFPIPTSYHKIKGKIGVKYFGSVSIYNLYSEAGGLTLTIAIGVGFSYKLNNYQAKSNYTISNSDSIVDLTAN